MGKIQYCTDVACFEATHTTAPVSYTQYSALKMLAGVENVYDRNGDGLYYIPTDELGQSARGIVFHKVDQLGAKTLITLTEDSSQTRALIGRINRKLVDIFQTDTNFCFDKQPPVSLQQRGIYTPESFIPKVPVEREQKFMDFFQAVGSNFNHPAERFAFLELVRTGFYPHFNWTQRMDL